MRPPPTDATQIIPDLARTPLTDRDRPDPLGHWLRFDALVLFAIFGTWALFTHRDWLRVVDTLAAIAALLGYFSMLLARD